MTHRAIALGLAIVVVVGAGLVLWAAIEGQVYAGRVLLGVTIEGQDVSGLDAPSLATRVRAIGDLALARPIVIRAGPHEFSRTAAELGKRAAVDRVVAAALAVGRTGSPSTCGPRGSMRTVCRRCCRPRCIVSCRKP